MNRTSQDKSPQPDISPDASEDTMDRVNERVMGRLFGTTSSSAPSGFKFFQEGAIIGKHIVLAHIGAGGMGVVYAAYDRKLGRKVALKSVSPHAAGSPGLGQARLLREAAALAKLSHPNVVGVYDSGIDGEQVWIAMEFVEGRTLRVWASEKPRRWPEILHVLSDAARGVAAAHEAGLVHRDLKPDNVMISGDDRVRVMDFGLAHAGTLDKTEGGLAVTTLPDADQGSEFKSPAQLTTKGSIVGTPAYMAPEQWQGHEAQAATDQFGWSVMAWEMLYGERPFTGQTPEALSAAVLAGKCRPPPKGRRAPRWLRRVLERGLATEPAQRFPTMAALVGELEHGGARARLRTAAVVLAGVAALGVGAAGLRRWDLAEREAACVAAGAEVDSLWDDNSQNALREAFLATGVSYAATSADKFMPWLNEYAAEWKQARTEACRNAEVLGDWSEDLYQAAQWCLEDRQMEFSALINELGLADAKAVQKAVRAAASLRRIADCTDAVLLQRMPPPPAQGHTAIRDVRIGISQAHAFKFAGRFEDALVLAADVRGRTEREFDWPPIWAAARLLESELLEKTGAYERAETAGSEAYFKAARVGAVDVAAEAATHMVYLVGYKRAGHAEGILWARLAELAIALMGDRVGLRESLRLNNLATVHQAAGAFEEALALHKRALVLREKTLGPDHPTVAASLHNLAAVHEATGAYKEARALYERALAIWEKALGPDHPTVAASLVGLANVYAATGAYEEARALQERALAIWEKALGPDHPDVAMCLTNLAVMHAATGAYEEARALHERALTIAEKAVGPDHPHVAAKLNNLGLVLVATGRYGEARTLYERALAITEKALGPDHPDLADSLNNLAIVHEFTGAYGEARALHERALAIKEKALEPDHPDIATSLNNLAQLHATTGAFGEARALYERALAIWEKTLGPDHTNVAAALDGLAQMHVATGEYGKAWALHGRALAIREKALGPDHPDVALSLFGLATVYLVDQEADKALPLLLRAMTIYDVHDGIQDGEIDAHFALAKALVATSSDRGHALAEANKARDAMRLAGGGMAKKLAEIERWLAKHERRR